jgi:hypothetical protein
VSGGHRGGRFAQELIVWLPVDRRIIGEGTYPQTITFVPQDESLPGSTLPIATVADGSIAVTTV